LQKKPVSMSINNEKYLIDLVRSLTETGQWTNNIFLYEGYLDVTEKLIG